MRILLALAAFAVVPATLPAQKAQSTDRWDSVRTVIRQQMTEQNLPSVSVAVAKDGKIIWEEAFGWADREKMIPATPNTMYSLASISKPMTATGLMTLVEKGKVDLDRPANDYLGVGKLTGLAGDASGATVRRVMSHTAGLPLHYQFYYADQPYPVVSNDETIARYGILVQPPGAVYEYSNLGYGIIDEIISRASGMEYADFMRTNVFVPLGLTHTSVGIGPGLEAYAAQRYDAKQRPIPFYDFDHRGASAVYSSAHDLVRFGMFHLKDHLPGQKAILTDASIDQMHRAVPPAPYGLGWIIADDDFGYRRVQHTGGMPGVQTVLNLYPSENLAVVVLLNFVGTPSRIVAAITSEMLPKWGAAARARMAERARQGPQAAKPFALPQELVGAWSGTLRTWERTLALSLVIKPDGDVHATIEGEPEALVHDLSWSDGDLVGRFAGTIPTRDASRWPHDVLFSLRLRDGTLAGMASALTTTERVYWALSSYASLTKKTAVR
jgi:CubicO group peptidase (beta-lactamase class C family)